MNLPETMQGVLLNGHGGPEQLEVCDDLPLPVAGAGEVLIQVGAAGVNNTDINTRAAWYGEGAGTWSGEPVDFPRIQGADVCGTIAAVGRDVDAGRAGERVLVDPCMRVPGGDDFQMRYLGSELDGGFAQFTKVPAESAYAIDSPLSDAELASFPCSYSTAENMLTRAALADSETVLVTGASGGVGSAAVQLARRRGARVIAVAGAAKSHAVFQLGADSVIPRGSSLAEALGAESIDVVIDMVGGEQWPELTTVLKRGGRYAVAGAVAGAHVPLDLRALYLKDLSFFGCTVLEPTVFTNLVGYIERAEIAPLVAETFPLAEIVAAQETFSARKHIGKIVLIPAPIGEPDKPIYPHVHQERFP